MNKKTVKKQAARKKKVFRLGMSPLTGDVYAGFTYEDGNLWIGKKQLVTSSFLQTIVEYMEHRGRVTSMGKGSMSVSVLNVVPNGGTKYWTITMKELKMKGSK